MAFKSLAVATALIAGVSGAAFAQLPCAPGFVPYGGVCRPAGVHGYGNPVTGAVSGEANGAAQGYATGGPVGAVVGGAVGVASGTLTGTANMLQGR